jgi:hypothetical protein
VTVPSRSVTFVTRAPRTGHRIELIAICISPRSQPPTQAEVAGFPPAVVVTPLMCKRLSRSQPSRGRHNQTRAR